MGYSRDEMRAKIAEWLKDPSPQCSPELLREEALWMAERIEEALWTTAESGVWAGLEALYGEAYRQRELKGRAQ